LHTEKNVLIKLIKKAQKCYDILMSPNRISDYHNVWSHQNTILVGFFWFTQNIFRIYFINYKKLTNNDLIETININRSIYTSNSMSVVFYRYKIYSIHHFNIDVCIMGDLDILESCIREPPIGGSRIQDSKISFRIISKTIFYFQEDTDYVGVNTQS